MPKSELDKVPSNGQTHGNFSLQIDQKDLAASYSSGNYEELITKACDWLRSFSLTQLKETSPQVRRIFDFNAEVLGHYLSRPDLNIKKNSLLKLLRLHQPLSNVFANSSYRNADFWASRRIENNRVSVLYLPLLLTRNSQPFSRGFLFDQNPELASEWYGQYLFGVRSFIDPVALENLRTHLRFWDSRMHFGISISNGYMRSTYIDPQLDSLWKNNFNNLTKRNLNNIKITNNPNKKSIAILTARWAKVHPTYKNRLPLFEELSKAYDLTLVHLGPKRSDIDTKIFKRVINASFQNGRLTAPELFNNDFSMAFYPDIGMNVESRFLSNLRLAPIQATTNSHPVSTFGSEIDFFITGAESEEAVENAHRHYSERLVLIPGIGTLPTVPQTPISVKSSAADRASALVCCPWGSLKANNLIVKTLLEIKNRASRKITYRFLMTLGADSGHLPPIYQDLIDILGPDSVELFADLPYERYMEKFAECDIAIDAFPFGGNTSIIDSIYLRKPMVSRAGWQFYNKAGSVILKKCGLSELCAESEEGYMSIILSLLGDTKFYENTLVKLRGVNLEECLGSLTSPSALTTACKYLIDKQPDASQRNPITLG